MADRAAVDNRRGAVVDNGWPPLYPAPLGSPCPGGGIGRRASFRCWYWQRCDGSSPFQGTSERVPPAIAGPRADRPCRRPLAPLTQWRRASPARGHLRREPLLRRDFLFASGFGVGGFVVPAAFGRVIAAEALIDGAVPVEVKRRLADAALAAATGAGATYCDVRVGRYLRQFVITRDAHVENVVSTESTGVGIRVIAGGAWGFAATNDLTTDGVATAARQAAADRQGQREEPDRAGSARADAGRRRGVVARADPDPGDDRAGQGQGGAAPRRQRRGAGERGETSSIRSSFRSTSRSISPRPTAATSTRTSIASGRCSASPSVDKATGKFRDPQRTRPRRWASATSISTATRPTRPCSRTASSSIGKSYDMKAGRDRRGEADDTRS